jgi:glyoxylase-like metal-dependent hydrolase (beta-lactamase superfamily II)
MRRLHKDLYWLRGLGGFINAYVWNGDTLLDAGAPVLARFFRHEMRQNGLAPESVSNVLLSHCHSDHAGGLLHFPQPLQVHAAAADLDVLLEKRPAHGYHPRYGFLVAACERLLPPTRLAEQHQGKAAADGDSVHGWRALHAPGHTPGSTLWYQPETRTVFVGDLLINHFDYLTGPASLFTLDYTLALESVQRLCELELETVIFGHGRPITENAEKRVRALCARLRERRAAAMDKQAADDEQAAARSAAPVVSKTRER